MWLGRFYAYWKEHNFDTQSGENEIRLYMAKTWFSHRKLPLKVDCSLNGLVIIDFQWHWQQNKCALFMANNCSIETKSWIGKPLLCQREMIVYVLFGIEAWWAIASGNIFNIIDKLHCMAAIRYGFWKRHLFSLWYESARKQGRRVSDMCQYQILY